MGQSKVLQYFGNLRYNLAALDAFAEVVKRNNHVGCEILSLTDTLNVLLAGFVSVAWSTASEFMVLGLPDFA